MMNFLLALQSAEYAIRLTFVSFVYNEGVWGFAVGFAAATVIYAFFLSENPGNIPLYLTKTAPLSFNQVAQRDASGKFLASYTSFQKEYSRVRIAFYFALLAFFLVILVALLRL
jgi:hypothetical protein